MGFRSNNTKLFFKNFNKYIIEKYGVAPRSSYFTDQDGIDYYQLYVDRYPGMSIVASELGDRHVSLKFRWVGFESYTYNLNLINGEYHTFSKGDFSAELVMQEIRFFGSNNATNFILGL